MSIRDYYLCCRDHEVKTFVTALRVNRIDPVPVGVAEFVVDHAGCKVFIGDEETECKWVEYRKTSRG